MTIAIKGPVDEGFLTATTTAQTLVELGLDLQDLIHSDTIHLSNNGAVTIYYFYGGATPTTTGGHPLPAGGERTLSGVQQITGLKLIAASGTVSVAYTLLAV